MNAYRTTKFKVHKIIINSQTPVSLLTLSYAPLHTLYQTVCIVLIRNNSRFHDCNFPVCDIFHMIFHDLNVKITPKVEYDTSDLSGKWPKLHNRNVSCAVWLVRCRFVVKTFTGKSLKYALDTMNFWCSIIGIH